MDVPNELLLLVVLPTLFRFKNASIVPEITI
jgi:hypothetical protein